MPSPVEYERRIVVFLDFLGFKDLIERSVTDPSHRRRIARAFETVRRFTMPDEGGPVRQVAQFSDCVVVSYEAAQYSAVFDLLLTILLLQVELVSQGFLVRGGVTVGDLLHRPGMVFGPALVEAHRLESREAIQPRILIDPALVDVARAYPVRHHDGEDEVRYVENFLTQDHEGGYYFIDYITWRAVVEIAGADSEDWPTFMRALAKILAHGLKSEDRRVLEKMLWLHCKYTAAIDEFFHPVRTADVIARFQDYYDALRELPHLHEEATAAIAMVQTTASSPSNST